MTDESVCHSEGRLSTGSRLHDTDDLRTHSRAPGSIRKDRALGSARRVDSSAAIRARTAYHARLQVIEWKWVAPRVDQAVFICDDRPAVWHEPCVLS
jgi:hypothetical protein